MRGEAETSKIARSKAERSGKAQCQREQVIEFLMDHPREEGYTRNELSTETKILLQSMCAAIKPLVNRGCLTELEKRECRNTKSMARPLIFRWKDE